MKAMFLEDDDDDFPPPRKGEDVAKAVVIAGLSALITGLVTWGIDELRERFGKTKPCPHCTSGKDS
jgi:hypothetical protein